MVGILFKMTIDTSISTAPVAAVEEIAEYHMEKEVLFSMQTVFLIGEVDRIDNTTLLYELDLQLTSDENCTAKYFWIFKLESIGWFVDSHRSVRQS